MKSATVSPKKSDTKKRTKTLPLEVQVQPGHVARAPSAKQPDDMAVVYGLLKECARTKFFNCAPPSRKALLAPFFIAVVNYVNGQGIIDDVLSLVPLATTTLAEHREGAISVGVEFEEPEPQNWATTVRAHGKLWLKYFEPENLVDSARTAGELRGTEATRELVGIDSLNVEDLAHEPSGAATEMPASADGTRSDQHLGVPIGPELPEVEKPVVMPAAELRAPADIIVLSAPHESSATSAAGPLTESAVVAETAIAGVQVVVSQDEAIVPALGQDAQVPGEIVLDFAETPSPSLGENVTGATARAFHPAPSPAVDVVPSATPHTWRIPRPMREAFGPGFPLEALDAVHRRYVEELARQVRFRVDASAVASLGVISAAAAKTAVVRVQDGEQHPLNLWFQIVARSGTGRTEVLQTVRSALDEVENEQRLAAQVAAPLVKARRMVHQRLVSRAVKAAFDAEDDEDREIHLADVSRLQGELDALAAPLPTRVVGDTSQARLVSLLAENRGRLAFISDEGRQFFSRTERASRSTADDVVAMLQAYFGSAIQREVCGKVARIVSPALTVVLAIQPGPFAQIMSTRSYHETGFLGRFLPVVLAPLDGGREQKRLPLSVEARHEFDTRVALLANMPVHDATDHPTTLTLTADAFELLSEFGRKLGHRIASGDLRELAEWGNKLWGATARIAGNLHLFAHACDGELDTTVTRDTIHRAILLAEYFAEHAKVAYSASVRTAEDEQFEKLLNWIRNSGRDAFTHVEALRATNQPAKKLRVTLAVLADRGYAREVPEVRRGSSGRHPEASYEVNPLWDRTN